MPESITHEQKRTLLVSATEKGRYRSLFYALFDGGANDKIPAPNLTYKQQETINRVNKISPQEANRLRRQFELGTTEVSLLKPILEALTGAVELVGSVKERICTFQIPLWKRRHNEGNTYERN